MRESKVLLSRLYAVLLNNAPGNDNSRTRWGKDLCVLMSEEKWIALMHYNMSFFVTWQSKKTGPSSAKDGILLLLDSKKYLTLAEANVGAARQF